MSSAVFEKMIDDYLEWLRSELSMELLEDGSGVELTTPFLDRHNDHLQIYVCSNNGSVQLSDDGYILKDLEMSGFELNSQKRKAMLQSTLNGFGVSEKKGKLIIETSRQQAGKSLHSLIQSMLAVNDLFIMARPHVKSLFWEDVSDFLFSNDIRFTSRVKLPGRTGYDHEIDFLIPKSKSQPDRTIKVINNPDKGSIMSCLFAFSDIAKMRSDPILSVAFLNDAAKTISAESLKALKQYNVTPITWSTRNSYIELLTS